MYVVHNLPNSRLWIFDDQFSDFSAHEPSTTPVSFHIRREKQTHQAKDQWIRLIRRIKNDVVNRLKSIPLLLLRSTPRN